jgi:hypothetical protein
MAIIFTGAGSLNVAADPADLPGETTKNTVISGAMQRCKNLRLDEDGKRIVRDGTTKIRDEALDQTRVHTIVNMGPVRYVFAGTKIYRNETAIETGLTDRPWSGVVASPFNSETEMVYACNGAENKRIEGSNVYNWGIEAPTNAPTVEAGSSTGLTGDYNAKYSYARKEGSTVVVESNLSDAASSAVTLADQSLKINFTQPTDAQVTHIRVYRTLTDGATYYHDQDIAIGGNNYVDSTTADGSLGTIEHTDHNPPPSGMTLVAGPTFDGTLLGVVDNLLYFSKPKEPDYWPTADYIQCTARTFPLNSITFHNGQAYVLSMRHLNYIQGTGATTFFPLPMEAVTGARGRNGALSVHGHGIFHTGADGLYLYSGQDVNTTQGPFRPIFRRVPKNGMPGATNMGNAMLVQFRNLLYFFFPGLNGEYGYTQDWEADDEYFGGTGYQITTEDETNEREYLFDWELTYATAADTDPKYRGEVMELWPRNALVFNLDRKEWSFYQWDTQFTAVAVDDHRDRLIAADRYGYIYHLEDLDADDDAGAAIDWEVQTKDYVLQTRAHFPRFIKYDVKADDAVSVTGTMILDDVVHQSHTLTGDRSVKRRLVTTGNGQRCSVRVTGSGPATIYALEAE